MKAIELRQVSFSYDGKTKILENADFSAEYGEVTLLSGHFHCVAGNFFRRKE